MADKKGASTQAYYRDSFDARQYYKEYFCEKECIPVVEFFIRNLHEIFQLDVVKGLPGRRFLDLGSGPVIIYLISASRWAKEIYPSEFSTQNLLELRKWHRGDDDALDFTEFFTYVNTLEGHKDNKILEKRLRNAVSDVIFCDLLATNPIEPRTDKFDVILCSLSLECVTTNLEVYKQCLKNMADLLTEGGLLILQGHFNSVETELGGQTLTLLTLTPEMLEEALIATSLEIVWRKEWDSGMQQGDKTLVFYSVVVRKIN